MLYEQVSKLKREKKEAVALGKQREVEVARAHKRV